MPSWPGSIGRLNLPCARREGSLWICGQRKGVAHIPTGPANRSQRQINLFRSSSPQPRAGHSQPDAAPTVISRSAIFARIQTAIYTISVAYSFDPSQCARSGSQHAYPVIAEQPKEAATVLTGSPGMTARGS
jgi:hypothetical protein